MRVFISGAMASHELDADRITARHAIDSYSSDMVAFAYDNFPLDPDYSPIIRHPPENAEIARSNALILLVGTWLSKYCEREYSYAYKLGMPCRVFARHDHGHSDRLAHFMSYCPSDIVYYYESLDNLTISVKEYCNYLSDADMEKQVVHIHTVNIWKCLIRELHRYPSKVYNLTPRKFEELIAEVITSFGYDTKLTKQSRDGGYDIIARRKDSLFPSLYLIETKLWAPSKRVGVPIIRGIYGAGMGDNCNGVMVVTPSMFTRDAIDFLATKSLDEYVRLIDGAELPNLYESYIQGKGNIK